MKQIWHYALDLIARRRVLARKNVEISPTAKVNYRHINLKNGKKSKLSIGEQSIIDGTLIFERDGAEISIGKRTFIGGATFISIDRIVVGDDVQIAWGTTFLDNNSHGVSFSKGRKNDVIDRLSGDKDWTHVKSKPIYVNNKAWIGFNSIILKGVTIGEGAIVGAGSVVTKNVDAYTVVAGNPAKVVRTLNLDER